MSQDRVVVIMGSAQGLGKGIAEKLGKKGYKLVISDINEEILQECFKELTSKNFEVSALPADVTKPEDHEALVQHAVDTYGRLDVYINNAGVEGAVEEIENIDAKNVDFVLDVNIIGVLYGNLYATK